MICVIVKKYSIFVSLLLWSALLRPQACDLTLRVLLRDLDNNEELSFAVVKVLATEQVLQSDAHGEFSLKGLCSGTHRFLIRHFDCRDTVLTVELTRSARVILRLPHSVNQLKEVDVMDKRVEMRRTQTESMLSRQELEAGKGQALGELLKNVSGMSTLNTGATISKPMLHGMQGNRLLILNNGVRQEGQQWGNEHAPEIDPFTAKKISVVKGASAIRYGSDAIAGVVLAEADELPDTSALTGELSLAGLSNGRTGAAAARLQGYFDRLRYFSWRLQGSLKKSGNLRTPDHFLTNTGLEERNFSYSLGYHRKKLGLELYYSQFNTQIGIYKGSHIGNLSDLQYALRYGSPVDSVSEFSYVIDRPYQIAEHELVKGAAHYHFSPRWRANLQYAWQYNIRKEYDLRRLSSAERAAGVVAPDLDLRLNTQSLDAVLEHDNIRSFRGMAGLTLLRQENTYSGRFFVPNYVNESWGAFVTERFVMPHVEFEAGLRYDEKQLESFYFVNKVWTSSARDFRNWTGNGGLIWKADSGFNLFVNAGTAWRAPAPNELYSNGIHQGLSAIERGDSLLNTEICYNVTTSGIFKRKRLKMEATLYYNRFSNFIYLQPTGQLELTIRGAFPVFDYRQADATIYGMDVKGDLQIHKKLSLLFKGMIVRGWNEDSNDYLIYMPGDRGDVSLKLDLPETGFLRTTFFQVTGSFVAKQWRVPVNSDFAPPPAAYGLFGLQLGGTVFLKRQPVELNFSISNLLNARYRDYLDRFRYYADAQGVSYNLRINLPLVFYDKKE